MAHTFFVLVRLIAQVRSWALPSGRCAELTEMRVAMAVPACGTNAVTYILYHIEIGERQAKADEAKRTETALTETTLHEPG